MIYYNGNYISDKDKIISYRDSGFTTGIGIFDSMLANDGKLIHGIEHFERIQHDTKTVTGLELSFNCEEFENICTELLSKNDLSNGFSRVRTTVTGGKVSAPLSSSEKLSVLIHVASTINPKDIAPIQCAIIKDFPRISGCVLENCKRLDYSRSYAARRQAETLGAEEAILTNTDGNIACGATSNVFIEENSELITPPLSDGVLAGVTRRKLMEERDVKEESISIERLHAADKIYLTNSFIGLRAVTLI